MSHQPRDQWLDAWGFAALSVLLLLAQRAKPTPSSVWGVGIFLFAALTVWALTSRRLTRLTPTPDGSAELSDAPAERREQPAGVDERACPICNLPVSGPEQVCTCGTPLVTDADRQRLRGPRGWLAVFRFGLLAASPYDVAAAMATSLAAGSDFSTGDWLRVLPALLLVSALGLYGVFVAVLLAHERPEGVRHARQYLVLNLIGVVGLMVKVGVLDGAVAAVEFLRYPFGALLGAYVWTRYFRQSRRVLITYGPAAIRSGVSAPTLALGTIAIALIVLVPLATLRAIWPSVEREWTLYAPVTSGFRLELPGTPELSDESFTEADGTVSVFSTALVETWDGMAFSVSYEDLPLDADLSDQAAILDAMRDGAIEPAALQESREIALRDFSGREFLAYDSDRQFFLAGRVFLVGRKTITLMAVTPGKRTPVDVLAADRFLKSFAIAE